MIHYWPINNDLADIIGGSNMTYGSNCALTYDRFNKTNSALQLKTGYFNLPQGTYFYYGQFTVSMWINVKSYGSWSRILDFGTLGINTVLNNVYIFYSGDKSRPGFQVSQDLKTSTQVVFANKTLQLNTWHHFAVTLNGTNGLVYINGDIAGKGISEIPINVTRSSNFIGQSNAFVSKFTTTDTNADADLDELRIYNRCLSSSEIYQLYNPTLTETTYIDMTSASSKTSTSAPITTFKIEEDTTLNWQTSSSTTTTTQELTSSQFLSTTVSDFVSSAFSTTIMSTNKITTFEPDPSTQSLSTSTKIATTHSDIEYLTSIANNMITSANQNFITEMLQSTKELNITQRIVNDQTTISNKDVASTPFDVTNSTIIALTRERITSTLTTASTFEIKFNINDFDMIIYYLKLQDLYACLINCSNRGICQLNSNMLFECKCSPLYFGKACNHDKIPCLYKPCINQYSCTDENVTSVTSEQIFNNICECSYPFYGKYCEFQNDTCADFKCFHKGRCYYDVDVNATSCICLKYYSGEKCELVSIQLILREVFIKITTVVAILMIVLCVLYIIIADLTEFFCKFKHQNKAARKNFKHLKSLYSD